MPDKSHPDYRRMITVKRAIGEKDYERALNVVRQVKHPDYAEKRASLIQKLEARVNPPEVAPESQVQSGAIPEVKPVSSIEKVIAGIIAAPGILIMIFVFIALGNDSSTFRYSDTGTLLIVMLVSGAFTALAAAYIQMREEKYKEYQAAKLEAERIKVIELHREIWGDDFCDAILDKQISIGMTPEMVELAWGSPGDIDQREVTATISRERWVYGTPRVDARYVSFKNGQVLKIKTS